MEIGITDRNRPSARAGMSLLEVILAIAVAGFVLAAAVSMLVSISSIWSERAERHFFVDHVDGVTEFLNATFATAGVGIVASDDGGCLLYPSSRPRDLSTFRLPSSARKKKKIP